MGMYDRIKSSYNLGPQFTNTICQTKGIEEGIGGTMTDYWISPDGVLWGPSYIGTHDLVEIEKDDPRYEDKLLFLNFQWVPTGKNGIFSPLVITKYVEIYPENWSGSWKEKPRLKIHFKNGVVQDYEEVGRGV